MVSAKFLGFAGATSREKSDARRPGQPGLDGHNRGVKVVARALRDAGVEVISAGWHQTSEQIAEAPSEDVEPLKAAGIAEIFTPETDMQAIID